jgi:hypothetical protein
MSSPIRRTANAIVTAFQTMDIDTMISLRASSCKRIFLPSSLNYAPQSNETYRASLLVMKSIFNSFHVSINDVIEGTCDDGKKKIIMFVTATGNTAVGHYKNEYVWKMAFEEGGERMCE